MTVFTFWRKRSALEMFKFSLYIVLPFAGGIIYANPAVMRDIILNLKLVEYPQAAPEPPVGEEINKFRAQSQIRPQQK